MDNRPIGVFDSGIGGLTVVNTLIKILPGETIYYVGDTARVPYGNKSKKRIQQFSAEITEWLIKKDCKMIVVACNTVSSLALDYLQLKFSIPIIGVIKPGVDNAVNSTRNFNIGVIGTQATINSNAYGKYLKSINPSIKTVSQSCPLFVPLVEEGWIDGDIPMSIAKVYLDRIINAEVDTVILGCTHYPLLKGIIQLILGEKINLVDSGQSIAQLVKSELSNNNSLSKNCLGDIHCFVTDDATSFSSLASRFLNRDIRKTIIIDIY